MKEAREEESTGSTPDFGPSRSPSFSTDCFETLDNVVLTSRGGTASSPSQVPDTGSSGTGKHPSGFLASTATKHGAKGRCPSTGNDSPPTTNSAATPGSSAGLECADNRLPSYTSELRGSHQSPGTPIAKTIAVPGYPSESPASVSTQVSPGHVHTPRAMRRQRSQSPLVTGHAEWSLRRADSGPVNEFRYKPWHSQNSDLNLSGKSRSGTPPAFVYPGQSPGSGVLSLTLPTAEARELAPSPHAQSARNITTTRIELMGPRSGTPGNQKAVPSLSSDCPTKKSVRPISTMVTSISAPRPQNASSKIEGPFVPSVSPSGDAGAAVIPGIVNTQIRRQSENSPPVSLSMQPWGPPLAPDATSVSFMQTGGILHRNNATINVGGVSADLRSKDPGYVKEPSWFNWRIDITDLPKRAIYWMQERGDLNTASDICSLTVGEKATLAALIDDAQIVSASYLLNNEDFCSTAWKVLLLRIIMTTCLCAGEGAHMKGADLHQALLRISSWRQRARSFADSVYARLAPSALGYVFGRDLYSHPVLVLRASNLHRSTDDEMFLFLTSLLDRLRYEGLERGVVEQWVLLFDMENCMEASVLSTVLNFFNDQYPQYTAAVYVVHCRLPRLATPRNFLESLFFPICGSNAMQHEQHISKFIPLNQLERRYGGFCLDLTEFTKIACGPIGGPTPPVFGDTVVDALRLRATEKSPSSTLPISSLNNTTTHDLPPVYPIGKVATNGPMIVIRDGAESPNPFEASKTEIDLSEFPGYGNLNLGRSESNLSSEAQNSSIHSSIPKHSTHAHGNSNDGLLHHFRGSKSRGTLERVVFATPESYTVVEREMLATVAVLADEKGVAFAGTVFADPGEQLRFLLGPCQAQPQKFVDCALQHLEWRNTRLPAAWSQIDSSVRSSGFCYIHKRDRKDRPTLIIHMSALKFIDRTEDAFLLLLYWVDFSVRKLMTPGKVEQLSVIIDLENSPVTRLPTLKVKAFVQELITNFPSRVAKVILLKPSSYFKVYWKMFVEPQLPHVTKSKIAFLSGETLPLLFKDFSKTQIPKCLGGRSKNAAPHPETGEFEFPYLSEAGNSTPQAQYV